MKDIMRSGLMKRQIPDKAKKVEGEYLVVPEIHSVEKIHLFIL